MGIAKSILLNKWAGPNVRVGCLIRTVPLAKAQTNLTLDLKIGEVMSIVEKESDRALPGTLNNLQSLLDEVVENGLEGLNLNKMNRAKRIRFFHNGNIYFKGFIVPVSSERYRSFDSLMADLTNIFRDKVNLPNGVRTIYTLDGIKVLKLSELKEGGQYVCSGKGQAFRKLAYGSVDVPKIKQNSIPAISMPDGSSTYGYDSEKTDYIIQPRFITVIRNGPKPRKISRVLINKRNASNMDQLLRALTGAIHLDSGAARKIFTSSGLPVTSITDIFNYDGDEFFFVYGSERRSLNDFQLNRDEQRILQTLLKMPKGTVTSY